MVMKNGDLPMVEYVKQIQQQKHTKDYADWFIYRDPYYCL